MFDLQVLAYQTDLTRVITFMLGREISGPDLSGDRRARAHHPISHHQNDPEKIAKLDEDQHVSRAAVRYSSRSCARRRTATARCSIT